METTCRTRCSVTGAGRSRLNGYDFINRRPQLVAAILTNKHRFFGDSHTPNSANRLKIIADQDGGGVGLDTGIGTGGIVRVVKCSVETGSGSDRRYDEHFRDRLV